MSKIEDTINLTKRLEIWSNYIDLNFITINDDLSINYNKDLFLNCGCEKFPFKFKIINGNFELRPSWHFTSLEGVPEIIHGNFTFYYSEMKSLEYFPKQVDGYVYINPSLIFNGYFKDNIKFLSECKTKAFRYTIDHKTNRYVDSIIVNGQFVNVN